MTDDTGQPTVDRLGALVDAAQNLIVSRNGAFSLRASNDEIRSFMWALTRAEQYLDAASPLTTPTPDKGALERARRLANRLAKHFIGEQFAAEDETCSRCVAMVTDALTAAASEARAAAIEEALSAAAEELIRLYDRSADRENFIKTSKNRIEIVSALATPAQSET